ncbi:MAG: HEAT repeat domain-containing protein [Bacteroidota bacterium]
MRFKLIHKILSYALSIIVLIVLVSVVVFFRFERFEINWLNFHFHNPVYYIVKTFTLKYYLVVYFIFVFIINIFALISYVLLIRFFRKYNEKRKSKLNDLFEELIINFMYVDFNNSSEENIFIKNRIKPYLNNIFSIELFVNKLIELNKDVDGENKRKLNILYKELNLNKTIVLYLYSPYWHHKIFALRVFSELEVSIYNSYILKLTKSKNEVLRAEANIALVQLTKRSNPLSFLEDYPFFLNKWEQTLVKLSLDRKKYRSIGLSDFIDSDNYSISEFAISLAGIFEMSRNRNQIIFKLNHKDYRVRHAAINALSKFENPNDTSILVQKFSSEVFVNKKAILKAIINTPNEVVFDFLICVIESEDFRLKLLAAKALKKMNVLFGISIDVLLNYTSEEVRKIALQTMDDRI